MAIMWLLYFRIIKMSQEFTSMINIIDETNYEITLTDISKYKEYLNISNKII